MVANENFFTRGYAQGDFAKLVEKDLEKELLSSPSETDRDRKVVEYGKRMADLVKDVQDLQISHKLLEGRTTEIEKRQDKYERENDEEHKEFREMKTSMAVVISKQDDMAEDVKTIKKATTGSSAFVETLYKLVVLAGIMAMASITLYTQYLEKQNKQEQQKQEIKDIKP